MIIRDLNNTYSKNINNTSIKSLNDTYSENSNGLTIKPFLPIIYTTFNGTNQKVDFTNNNISTLSNSPFTYMGWVYVWQNTLYGSVFTERSGNIWKDFQFNTDSYGMQLIMQNTTSQRLIVRQPFNTTPAQLNTWHHVAWCYDGTANGSGVRLVLDGVSQTTETLLDSLTTSTNLVTSTPIVVGYTGITTNYSRIWADELAFYNVNLSDSEIQAVIALGRNSPDYSNVNGIVAHWAMDTLNPIDKIGNNNGLSFNMDETNIIQE